MIPLNQTYKENQTFLEYPKIKLLYNEYNNYCLNIAKWHKTGRTYDCALSLFRCDFNNKVVCELGARDSIFSSFLTQYVNMVHTSDIFMGWGDLGTLEFWDKKWKDYAFHPEKIFTSKQNMAQIKYPDNFFDIVISFSAIEHIYQQDVIAIQEMVRICKPGGKIIISTDIANTHQWVSGGYFYDEQSLFNRLIIPSRCVIDGDYDFSFMNTDQEILNNTNLKYTSAFFILKKG